MDWYEHRAKKNAKNYFEKEFFKQMNNTENGECEKNRHIKLVTTKTRRNSLVSKPNYHPRKFFSENLLTVEIKKITRTWTAWLFRLIDIGNK